ncbi:MAG: hypothetical protein KGJ35_03230 [Patescibacteria group bacterium]|nr:hypothetical protein [Patescibacteria group bacterium]
MNVLEIIPIARGTKIESLSYFTAENPPLGALVEVPVRSKTIHGIVASVTPAAELKADLKTAEFSLKKIEKVKARHFLSPAFMSSARAEANYAGATIGATLKAMVHSSIFTESERINIPEPASPVMIDDTQKKNEHKEKKVNDEVNEKTSTKVEVTEKAVSSAENSESPFPYPLSTIAIRPELPFGGKGMSSQTQKSNLFVHAIQGDDDERYGAYRSMIRESFARKKSLIFLTPTAEEAAYLFGMLEKGIENYIHILHGDMTAKNIRETWNKATTEKHAVVMVATGTFMAFSRGDLETLIIERMSARGWKGQRRPYLDLHHVAETYGIQAGLAVYMGDVALPLETSHRQATGRIEPGSPWKTRSISSAKDSVIDMKQYKGESFRILSSEVENLIRRTREENAHMVIIAGRKGLSPTTVCGDCHSIVTCNTCGAPVVLHQSKHVEGEATDSTYFLCHHCGERRSTEEYCKTCGSWKLGTVGIGIDLVRKKIADLFPGIKIFQLDSDTASTPRRVRDTVEKFKSTPGSILLGTELTITHFHDHVPYAAVVTMDSILSLPDFRIAERLFYFLIRLRSLTEREFIIQTRRTEDRTFEFAAKGNIADFVRYALLERRQFEWPPYSTLIKLSIEGKRDAIAAEMESIKGFLAPVSIDVFPSFTAGLRGNSLLHGLIRLSPSTWPNDELLAKLRSLPPSVSVNVDPESLL